MAISPLARWSPAKNCLQPMTVHTIGAVIPPGGKLLEIVPGNEKLLVEAQVSPLDVDRIRVGQTAEVRLTAFKSRDTPSVYGKLIAVSADRLMDEKEKLPFYLARIEIDAAGMQYLAQRKLALVPGMPSEVLINTGEHTLLRYRQTLNARDIEKQNAKAVALEKLSETVGMTVAEVAPLSRQDIRAAPGSVDQWLGEGTQNNRNLRALRYAIESEERTVASARAEYVPQMALLVSRTHSDSDPDSRRSRPFNVSTIGLQLTMSLYDGGKNAAGVHEALARQNIALAQYDQKRREIETEIRTAYLGTVANRARVEATAQAVRAQEKSRDAQQRSYELAVSTVVDLLDSEKRLFQLRSEQSKARYDFILSLVVLRIRAGALSDRDIEEINGWE